MPLKDRGTTMGMYKESLEAFIALLTYAYRSIWLHRALTHTHTHLQSLQERLQSEVLTLSLQKRLNTVTKEKEKTFTWNKLIVWHLIVSLISSPKLISDLCCESEHIGFVTGEKIIKYHDHQGSTGRHTSLSNSGSGGRLEYIPTAVGWDMFVSI